MEHLWRPGLRRGQLERRLRGVPPPAHRVYSAEGSVLLVHRNHPAGTPGTLVRIPIGKNSLPRAVCHATNYRGAGYLSGIPRTVSDRKSTRLNSSHVAISYAIFCL